jgi:hypothetical protein
MYRQLAASSEGVYFRPWIGRDYGNSSWGLRVLIVGESHYEYEPARWQDGSLMPQETTQHIIGDLIGPEKERRAHWTKLATLFLGERPPNQPPTGPMFEFWHSVAYFNFVQEAVGIDNQFKATDEMFASSCPAFPQVLAQSKPDFVLVTSRKVWSYLAPDLTPLRTAWNRGSEITVMTASRGSSMFMGLPHPRSAQFGNARHWHPAIMEALKRLRDAR